MSPRWHGQPQRVLTAFTAAGTATKFGGVTNLPSIWNFVPNVTFSVGVTATFPTSGTYQSNNYVTDPENDTITLTKNSVFVQGVTWDGGKFITNGTGSATTSTGHILTANDGRGHFVDSSAFQIALITTAAAQQVAYGNFVLLNDDRISGPNAIVADSSLATPWQNQGGDYKDSAGTLQGSIPYAAATLANGTVGQDKTWTLPAALINSLLLSNTGLYLKATSGGGNVWFASRQHPTILGPRLSIQTTNGTFNCACIADTILPAGAGAPQIYDNYFDRILSPGVMKFDLSSVTGLVQSATLTMTSAGSGSASFPAVFGIFLLVMPTIVTDPVLQLGGAQQGLAATVTTVDTELAAPTNFPTIASYDRFDSHDTVWSGEWYIGARPLQDPGYGSGEWTYLPTYVPWTEYGVNCGRITVPKAASNPGNASGSKMWKLVWPGGAAGGNALTILSSAGPPNPLSLPRPWQTRWSDEYGPTELYVRFLLMVEEDVWGNMEPTMAIKLLGPQNADDNGWSWPQPAVDYYSRFLSSMLYLFRPSPSNPDLFRVGLYHYDYASHLANPGGGTGSNLYFDGGAGDNSGPHNFCVRAGQKYCFEIRIKQNTSTDGGVTFNADGIIQAWVDGVQALNITNRRIRNHSLGRIKDLVSTQFFHGGTLPPIGDLHFQLGAVVTATQYIGPPKLQLPSWVPAAGTFKRITGANTLRQAADTTIYAGTYGSGGDPGAAYVSWSSGDYAPGEEYGNTYGAAISCGEDHNAVSYISTNVFDFDTRQWSIKNVPSQLYGNGNPAFPLTNGFYQPENIYNPGHTYSGLRYYPPSWGSPKTKGELYFYSRIGANRDHLVARDISITNGPADRLIYPSVRAQVGMAVTEVYGNSAADFNRKGFWFSNFNSIGALFYKAGGEGTPVIKTADFGTGFLNEVMMQWPRKDVLLGVHGYSEGGGLSNYYTRMTVINCATGALQTGGLLFIEPATKAAMQADQATGYDLSGSSIWNPSFSGGAGFYGLHRFSWSYSTILDCLVGYAGMGTGTVYIIDLPSDPYTGTFNMRHVTLTSGDAFTPNVLPTAGEMHGNFMEVPRLRSYFWAQSSTVAPQLFRLPGM